MRTALGDVFELLEQETVVGFVVPVHAGKARRIDSGRPAEGIDAQAAVIGDGAAAGNLSQFLCLLDGVFHEGGAVFNGLVLDPGLAHGLHIVKEGGEDRLHLGQLMGIVGCNDQFHSLLPCLSGFTQGLYYKNRAAAT